MNDFDFGAFSAAANDIDSSQRIVRDRKTRADARNERRRKTKKILNKVAAVAEKAFEIYVMLKNRRDPLGLALGAVSAYNVVSDLFEREPPQANSWLRSTGAVKVFPIMTTFIYHTLRQMDIDSVRRWGNDAEEEAEKIEEFDLGDGVKVWFVMSDAKESSSIEPHEGAYVMDPDRFVDRFSATVQQQLGSMLSINTFTKGWDDHYYLGSVNIPTDLYVSPIDEANLQHRVDALQDMGFNRALLFYGPPGVGKTTLAARMAKRVNGRLLVATARLLESGRGRTLMEGLIDILDPTVILFDDLDKMWRPNDMLESMERLNRKDDARKRLLIATVNTLSDIPEPMRRPGRFDEIIEFTNPSLEQRSRILAVYFAEFGLDVDDAQCLRVAEASGGMTGAYLREVAKRAKVVDIDRLLEEVAQMKRICNIEDEDEDEDDDGPEEDGRVSPPGTQDAIGKSSTGTVDGSVLALAKALAAFANQSSAKTERRGWHTPRERAQRERGDSEPNEIE